MDVLGWTICPEEQPGLHVDKMDEWMIGDECRVLANRCKWMAG